MGEHVVRGWVPAFGARSDLRWSVHLLLKQPLFGRFMKPWRWPSEIGQAGWTQVRIASRSHSSLAAIVRETDAAVPLGVVVCAHPMGRASKGFWLRGGHAQALLEAGFHVVAYDFNGFGESASTNFDFPGDAISVGAWARGRFPDLAVHALGASFGAMNTISAMADPAFPYDRVVAEGCSPSLAAFWKAYPFANAVLTIARAIAPGVQQRLRPEASLAHMRAGVRLLLVHSKADEWTPVAHGDRLAAAAPAGADVRRLILDRAAHTHGLRDEAERYWPAVSAFLSAD
jgi:uncharacterized protein